MGEKGTKQRRQPTATVLAVRVTPRSKKDEISEILADGTVKVRLTAPPVEGKANEALLQFLAEVMEVSPARITILTGQTGRNKRVAVEGIEPENARKKISSWQSGD